LKILLKVDAMKINPSIGGAIIGAALLSLPAQAATLGQSIVKDWNNIALEAIKNSRPGPTQAARALSIVHTGMYDAWAAYDPVAIGTQLCDLQLPDSENTLASKAEAISYAAYNTLIDQFPTQKSSFDNLMATLGLNPNNTSSSAAAIGKQTAQALLDFRRDDGSNQYGNLGSSGIPFSDYTGYTPVNPPDTLTNTNPNTIVDPDRWQPLQLPNGTVQQFITPYWNRVTPFGLESGDQLRPAEDPKKFSEDPEAYIKQAEKVVKISGNLTDKEKAIAEWWAAGPGTVSPLGLWDQFAQEISTKNNYNLDDDVKLFFALNNAYLDASIATWDAKVAFDYVRPATAIHYLASQGLFPNDGESFRINPETGVQEVFAWAGSGRGSQWILGTEWRPYLGVTPPFAEFVSAHSTFSGAAAEILRTYTGSDTLGTSRTLPRTSSVEPGGFASEVTLSWDTLTQAVEEAGFSRLYGGIHFDDGNLVGQSMGRDAARLTWKKAQYYIQGGRTVPEPASTFGLLALGVLGAGSALKRKKQRK
jgi:hypothetical protein